MKKVGRELRSESVEKVLERESEEVLLMGGEQRSNNCKEEWLERRILTQV